MDSEHLDSLNKFFNEYKDYYNFEDVNYFKDLLLYSVDNSLNFTINQNELVNIYTKLGFYNLKEDGFFQMNLNKLKKYFSLDCNILEIGGGPLAVFSNLIANEQIKLGKGSVSIYDPVLIEKSIKFPNITPYKKKISFCDDVSKYDLIVGIYPCDASELLIELACKNKKNFYIALCGCDHYDKNSYYWYSDDAPFYYEYVCDKAAELVEKYDNGILVVDSFGSALYPYPVLYNKKVRKR